MVDFEKKLKHLFDFQRFEKQPEIELLMKETEQANSYLVLSEDDLSMVCAAGEGYHTESNSFLDDEM